MVIVLTTSNRSRADNEKKFFLDLPELFQLSFVDVSIRRRFCSTVVEKGKECCCVGYVRVMHTTTSSRYILVVIDVVRKQVLGNKIDAGSI